MQTTTDQYVGIDVGKDELAVAVLPTDDTWTVTNTAPGWEQLVRRVQALAPTTIVLEATGSYHLDGWIALDLAGRGVAVINPGRTHAFAQSEPHGAKTDRHDARLLARFGQQKQPPVTPLPSQHLRDLRDLVAYRDDLTTMRIAEQNRVQTARTALVRTLHEETIADLAQKQARVDQAITDLIASDAALADRRRLLATVPGCGPVISAVLVAGLPELGAFDAKAIAALAGVAPHPRDSGKQHGKRMITGGRPVIRKALYQLAFNAVRWESTLGDHYDQLHERRLLGILTVMIRDGLTWQETRVGQGEFLVPAA